MNARRIISGKVELSEYGLQMVHPDYMVAPDKAGDIPEVEPINPPCFPRESPHYTPGRSANRLKPTTPQEPTNACQ